MQGQDIFDIIDLLRQHELALAMMPASHRDGQDSVVALVEIVAIVGAASGHRIQPSSTESEVWQSPNSLVKPIREQAAVISKLAQVNAYAELTEAGPLGPLASRLRASELMIRNKHYISISHEMMNYVLEDPRVREMLVAELGFGFAEVFQVSRQILERYGDQRIEKLDLLGRIAQSYSREEPIDERQAESAAEAMASVFATPGESSSFTGREIAARSAIPERVVEEILELFSVQIEPAEPLEAVMDFVHGSNKFAGKGLLRDPESAYLIVSEAIPAEAIRARLELQMKASSAWTEYDSRRSVNTERLVVDAICEVLGGTADSRTQLLHYAPTRKHEGEVTLGKGDFDHLDEYAVVEADALVLVDRLAFCVEVKAGSITARAREGRLLTLARDVERTIGDANFQASRLRSLIVHNRGLWLKGKRWLDLSHIREIYCIAVCLDDLGPLAIGVDDLIRAGVLHQANVPWIVSLHDLQVLKLLTNHPAEFALYVSRRTDPRVSMTFQAVDELDLVMLYFKGHYYLRPDPDEIHSKFPDSLPPTKRDRQLYRRQSVRTHVQTHTDGLDAWMDGREGLGPESDRPLNNLTHGAVAQMIDSLELARIPGWLLASMDLVDMDGETCSQLTSEIEDLIRQVSTDGAFHSAISVFYTGRGSWALILGCSPHGESQVPHVSHLEDYMRAKRYQLRLDRVLGFLIDSRENIQHCAISDFELQKDEDTEALISAMGLLDARQMRLRSRPETRSSKRKKPQRKRRN